MRKHPVSIALSNRILEKIDKEASKQKRSRREYTAKKLATTPKKLIKVLFEDMSDSV